MVKQGKTITIDPWLEEKLVKFFDDKLNYYINESHCAEEYGDDIMTGITFLNLLGYKNAAEDYQDAYNRYLSERVWKEM